MRFKLLIAALIIARLAAAWPARAINAWETLPGNPVLISEVQTYGVNADGTENPILEFVELYNNGDQPVVLDGWQLDFLTQKHDGISLPTRVITKLAGTLAPYSYWLVSHAGYLQDADYYFDGGPSTGYLPKGSGTVRLLNADGQLADLVGYGSPNNYQVQPAKAPPPGQSIQRCLAQDQMANSQNNFEDFAVYSDLSPSGGPACPQTDTETWDPGTGGLGVCAGPVLAEILPNPAGTDADSEFIEIFNPTDGAITLSGCGLQTTANGQIYWFNGGELAPGQYLAVYNSQSALVLPNAAGGTVYLLSGDGLELQAVNYPGGLDDDVAWAWFGQQDWQATYIPAPNAENIKQPTKPCPAGQERSLETGRCRTVTDAETVAANLKPCPVGQERNPDTGRCRLAQNSNTLKPCAEGQERNPDTNRCRLVAAAAASLKPCPQGQQRSPDTNRCRKIGEVLGASTTVKDIAAKSVPLPIGWPAAGLALAGVMGYGAWEWRYDLRAWAHKARRSVTKA